MFRSTSHVRTESAARYVNRLCKHWGHTVSYTHLTLPTILRV